METPQPHSTLENKQKTEPLSRPLFDYFFTLFDTIIEKFFSDEGTNEDPQSGLVGGRFTPTAEYQDRWLSSQK